MAKDLSISILMDFYGGMLTDKRFDVLDMYYNSDMSLSEIADEVEISRQGVRDAIKHGERRLGELEEKLGLAKHFLDIKDKLDNIKKILDEADEFEGREKIREILTDIENEI